MADELSLRPIARIRTDFPSKFGIPRQAGLVEQLQGRIVFEPEFRIEEALRGIEDFSHLWLIWGFSENSAKDWSPTVRPPRLGGNRRMGVFATRSPFRPNSLGLSCVRLLSVRKEADCGTSLLVAGADMVDGTPIYDIKPYLPYADSVPEAVGGFAASAPEECLEVLCPPELLRNVPEEKRDALLAILAADPRPRYQKDPERVYGMDFAGRQIRFRVKGTELSVLEIA
ncbi:MAG: tRNA (N6-threonylcarbamoyladenosine(37)-N6)-methyltransferase TrmO [Oscillospiraceae bacterium]|nr:tRNA (N6-threonylcarbamoyladenosine(37)-N6)-methyltransferase TrmO [Oscillospiraceae bacterium]